jgi:hypothetical protein
MATEHDPATGRVVKGYERAEKCAVIELGEG